MKFWPESHLKPGPWACGWDWVVTIAVAALILFLASS